MAERRMFAKSIVLSDAFLDMPLSTRCLYFTLGMLADDDGFINSPRSVMRQCGATEDDLKLLLVKKFLLSFEDGVIVIKHWRIHNYIQKDRYVPTKYPEHKLELSFDENNAYTLIDSTINIIESQPLSSARQKRLDAIKTSSLPYSFMYKIRNAFIGEECPICHCKMGVADRRDDDPVIISNPIPTIQHNVPISLGGEHEIDNISVICKTCNLSIQDKPTGKLNNDLVKKKWSEICSVSGMDTQVSIGKDSIELDKDRLINRDEYKPTLKDVVDFIETNSLDDLPAFTMFRRITNENITDWKEYLLNYGK